MIDLRAPALPAAEGEHLPRPIYKRDFAERGAAIRDGDSWKLERRQHFEEQGNASRDALRRGDWEEAVRLLEAQRDALRAAAAEQERRGYRFHRVRVAQEPLTPYLRWELYGLRLRAQYGARVRVVDVRKVAGSEADSPLPEVVVLGEHTLYQVLYTDIGVPNGAVRYTDRGIVGAWSGYLRELYGSGEDVTSYFDRKVADLPPP